MVKIKNNHDLERGLTRAAEIGPEGWADIEKQVETKGYEDVRHFLECIDDSLSSEYIDGFIEGMGADRTRSVFLRSAGSRETDLKIIEAIWWLSGKDETRAERIWQDPTNEEMIAIWERVTNNGLRPSNEFCWGKAGSAWADDLEGGEAHADR